MSNASQAINSLNQTISSFKSKLDVKVNSVSTSTSHMQATTDQIYANINKFRTNMQNGEENQIAHENIIRIDQLIREQFSNYAEIRRTVMGVVKDFDINLVRNSTIQELSEELWMTSSRYWLSYALIAITAWVNNYRTVAKNALAEGGRKDPIKTTLFFCLLNLRFARMDAAKMWFKEYFSILDPAKLQQETAILLQAYLCGVFGKDKQLEMDVVNLIDSWIKAINDNEEISNQLLTAYENYIAQLSVKDTSSFENIPKYVTNFDDIRRVYNDSKRFAVAMDIVKELDVDAAPQHDDNYKSRIDAILVNLITNYDAEELELQRQKDYFTLVMKNDGQVDKAEEQFNEMQRLLAEDFNIGAQMLRWAIYDNIEQTDITVRKFGFQNTKSWFVRAVENYDEKLLAQFPMQYGLKIDTWAATSTGDDLEEQMKSLNAHFENNKFNYMYVNSGNIAAAIAILVSLGLAFLFPFILIGTAVAAGILAFRIISAKKKFPKRVQAATEALSATMDEIALFRSNFEKERAKKDELLGLVAEI